MAAVGLVAAAEPVSPSHPRMKALTGRAVAFCPMHLCRSSCRPAPLEEHRKFESIHHQRLTSLALRPHSSFASELTKSKVVQVCASFSRSSSFGWALERCISLNLHKGRSRGQEYPEQVVLLMSVFRA